MDQSLKVNLEGRPAIFVHVVAYCWLRSKAPLVERESLTCQSEHRNRRKGVEPPLIVKRYLFLSSFFSVQRPYLLRTNWSLALTVVGFLWEVFAPL